MEKLKTYRKWQKKKRQVQRGEKAQAFNRKGKALFARSQTKPILEADYYYEKSAWPHKEDYDDFYMEFDRDMAMAFDLYG